MPDHTDQESAEKIGIYGRDVHNESQSLKPLTAPKHLTGFSQKIKIEAVINTSRGEIHLELYSQECPKTVENFTTHAKNGYYSNLIFHRVVKGFMIQTGDPNGDGSGGTSIWGSEFEDEISDKLKHREPFMLAMANCGKNTNGS